MSRQLLQQYERQATILIREPPRHIRENLARAGVLRFLGLEQPEMFDAHANFAYSTVATAPSPATSGTSLVVHAGDGALFPAVPFNAVVWPSGAQPLSTNAEIVRVTVRSTDTLTITRTQESTSARSIVAGDQIANVSSAKVFTDIEHTFLGAPVLVYRYTVTGSDKTSIDTGADTADAGSNDWTNGDLLEVLIVARTDDAGATSNANVNVNNDSGGTTYDHQQLAGASTTASAATSLAQGAWVLQCHGSGGSASYPMMTRITIPDYAGTVFNKVGEIADGVVDATAGNNSLRMRAIGWRNTAAITRLAVAATAGQKLKVGSQLLIYKRLAS